MRPWWLRLRRWAHSPGRQLSAQGQRALLGWMTHGGGSPAPKGPQKGRPTIPRTNITVTPLNVSLPHDQKDGSPAIAEGTCLGAFRPGARSPLVSKGLLGAHPLRHVLTQILPDPDFPTSRGHGSQLGLTSLSELQKLTQNAPMYWERGHKGNGFPFSSFTCDKQWSPGHECGTNPTLLHHWAHHPRFWRWFPPSLSLQAL